MKTVHDLNKNELEELRDRYFHQLLDGGEEDIDDALQIPMSNVIAHYEEYHFVEEDFWCNINVPDKRFIYLAKLGILESTNEKGNYDIQRIDDPQTLKEEYNLDFLPQKLSSDEEAKEVLKSLTHEQLESL